MGTMGEATGPKWKKAHYGLPELSWIIEMVAYDVSVNVGFFTGAGFDVRRCLADQTGSVT